MASFKTSSGQINELALTIINTGEGYSDRVALARREITESDIAANVRLIAHEWLNITTRGAREYDRQFGSAGASCFTVLDILQCANELAVYYAEHLLESK